MSELRHVKRAVGPALLAVTSLAACSEGSQYVGTVREASDKRLEIASAGLPERHFIIRSGSFVLDMVCNGETTVEILAGDTLSKVAGRIEGRMLGPDLPLPSTPQLVEILALTNEIDDPNLIFAGDSLTLPNECSIFSVDE